MYDSRNNKKWPPLHESIEITATQTINAAYKVHTVLGPGLTEKMYEASLAKELESTGVKVMTQVPIPMKYKDSKLPYDLRLDMIVNDCLLVELKSVKEMDPYYISQVLTYLYNSDFRLALLINFGNRHLKNNIKRLRTY